MLKWQCRACGSTVMWGIPQGESIPPLGIEVLWINCRRRNFPPPRQCDQKKKLNSWFCDSCAFRCVGRVKKLPSYSICINKHRDNEHSVYAFCFLSTKAQIHIIVNYCNLYANAWTELLHVCFYICRNLESPYSSVVMVRFPSFLAPFFASKRKISYLLGWVDAIKTY